VWVCPWQELVNSERSLPGRFPAVAARALSSWSITTQNKKKKKKKEEEVDAVLPR